MSATNAIGLYRDVVNDRIARSDAKNARLAGAGQHLAGTLGDVYAQGQEADRQAKAREALKTHFVTDLGADPTEADRVLDTKNRDVINKFGQDMTNRLQMRKAAGMLGFDQTTGMSPGMADTFMGVGGAAPPAAAPGGALPPGAAFAGSNASIGSTPLGVPMKEPGAMPPAPPRGQGPYAPPGAAAPTGMPPAATSMPSRADLYKRFLSQGGGDLGALQAALAFLPPEAKPMTEEDNAQAAEARARAALANAQAGVVGQAKPDRDNEPLTADIAAAYGIPAQYVGKITIGDAKEIAKRKGEAGGAVEAGGIVDVLGRVERGEKIPQGMTIPSNVAPGVVNIFGQRMRGKRPPISDSTAAALGIEKGTPLDEVKFLVDHLLSTSKAKNLSGEEIGALRDIRKQNQDFITERGTMAAMPLDKSDPSKGVLMPELKKQVDDAVEQNRKIDAVLMGKLGGAGGLGNVPPPPDGTGQSPEQPTPEELQEMDADGMKLDPKRGIVPE